MAVRRKFSAVMVATLAYYDEPQVILLKRSDDKIVIAVAIDKEGPQHPFLGAEINNSQWERYKNGSTDLRYLFLFPKWKKWYTFDLADIDDNEIPISLAEEGDYKNEDFLPSHGFFFRDHTEQYEEEETLTLSTQDFDIDGAWDLPDFSVFYGNFTDLYSFFLSLLKFTSDNIRLDLKKRIREAYFGHPMKGGFSYVNLYNDLLTVQEKTERLSVQSIEYASPGYVSVAGKDEIFRQIADSLTDLESNYESAKSKYKDIHGYLRENSLLKADKEKFDPDTAVAKFLYSQCEEFSKILGFSQLELVHRLTSKNSLLTAKVLLSYFRRLERYYMFFAEGRVNTDNGHRRSD